MIRTSGGNTVDELLRYAPIAGQGTARVSREDVVVRGSSFARGEGVIVSSGSANKTNRFSPMRHDWTSTGRRQSDS